MKVFFSGCSFTAGAGWDQLDLTQEVKNCPNLWVNLCHQRIPKLSKLNLINVAKSGASNTDIFLQTVKGISEHGNDIDTIFCQWSAAGRYNFNLGFELWDTSESFNHRRTHPIRLSNGENYTREYINNLVSKLKALHHLHWEIVKIVEYSNILLNLATKTGIKHVFFVNGLCPWDNDYFAELHNVLPEKYTSFTKKHILEIDSRTDEDIYKLYKLAHHHYQEAGGIKENHWINLYDSFIKHKIDTNFDGMHPGIKSNQFYFNLLEQNLILLNYN